jgi:hypothetical protein
MSVIAGPATTEIALTGSPQRCYPGKVRMLEHRKTGPGIGSPRLMLSNYFKLRYCRAEIAVTLPRSLPTFVWDSLKRASFAAPSWSMTESTIE